MAGNPTIDNLHPVFLQQLMAFEAASGGLVTLDGGSGWRSVEKQAQLYADWLAGKPGQARAAPPLRSNHNFGLAFDLKFASPAGVRWAHENAARFGLHFPLDDENWHVEPIALGDMKGSGGGMFDMGFQALSPEEAKDRAKSLYGYLGWFVDHKEIGPIIVKAAMEGWDAARLQGALSETTWWRTTSESARQFDALLVSDNATAARRIKETALGFRLQAAQLGIPIDDNRLFTMSAQALRMGWNDEEMQLALAAEMRWNPKGIPTGGVANLMGEVAKMGADYMVPMTDKQQWEWSRRIVGGASDMAGVEAQMQLIAAARFPHLTKQIQQGITPGQFFTPYRNAIAQVLEMSPDDIDLMSKEWGPVTSYADPRTGQARPMTFTEAERYARSRPEWSRTNAAWETTAPAIQTLLEIFGEVA